MWTGVPRFRAKSWKMQNSFLRTMPNLYLGHYHALECSVKYLTQGSASWR